MRIGDIGGIALIWICLVGAARGEDVAQAAPKDETEAPAGEVSADADVKPVERATKSSRRKSRYDRLRKTYGIGISIGGMLNTSALGSGGTKSVQLFSDSRSAQSRSSFSPSQYGIDPGVGYGFEGLGGSFWSDDSGFQVAGEERLAGPSGSTFGVRGATLLSERVLLHLDAAHTLLDAKSGKDGDFGTTTAARVGIGWVPDENMRISAGFGYRDTRLAGLVGKTEETVAYLGTRFFLLEPLSVVLQGSYDMQDGLNDPTVSLVLHSAPSWNAEQATGGLFSVGIAAPVSDASRASNRITQLGISTAGLRRDGEVTLRLGAAVQLSFYDTASGASAPAKTSGTKTAVSDPLAEAPVASTTASTQPEKARTTADFGLTYAFSPSWRLGLGAGVGYLQYTDSTARWDAQLVFPNLVLSKEDWSIALSGALVTDPEKRADRLDFPSQPLVGLKLEYVFGERNALRQSPTPLWR